MTVEDPAPLAPPGARATDDARWPGDPVLPPATIGILGGGQLGRMLGFAAREMGYRIVVLDPDPDCPASPIAWSSAATTTRTPRVRWPVTPTS